MKYKGIKIAVAGKGGVGKTTITGLIIRYLVENKKGKILAVDADTNSNLHEVLGMEVRETIGNTRELMRTEVPQGMPKETFIEYKVMECVNEGDGFDLIVMGTPEGQGCYCAANTLCKKYIDILLDNYDYIVMDNEAGMEHMSRLLTKDVDHFFIVSDPSRRSVNTVKRMIDLAKSIKLNIGNFYVIINRAKNGIDKDAENFLKENNIDISLILPEDEYIAQYDREGNPTYKIPAESETVKRLHQFLAKIL